MPRFRLSRKASRIVAAPRTRSQIRWALPASPRCRRNCQHGRTVFSGPVLRTRRRFCRRPSGSSRERPARTPRRRRRPWRRSPPVPLGQQQGQRELDARKGPHRLPSPTRHGASRGARRSQTVFIGSCSGRCRDQCGSRRCMPKRRVGCRQRHRSRSGGRGRRR